MKKYNWRKFFNISEVLGLPEKINARLDLCEKEYITDDMFCDGPEVEFTHFIHIHQSHPIDGDFYLAIKCLYEAGKPIFGDPHVTKTIEEVWCFENEEEYVMYQVLIERENPNNMDPLLWN